MRVILLCVLLVLTHPALADNADITIRLQRHPGPVIGVSVTLPGDADGRSRVTLAESWGGVEGAGREIRALEAESHAGEAREVRRTADHEWLIDHEPGERLTLRYTLEPGEREPMGPGRNDYRTRVSDNLFYAIGNLAIILRGALPGDLECEILWEGFDDWTTASSLGPGPSPPRATLTIESLRNAFFIAGSPGTLRLHTRAVGRHPIGLAVVDAPWGFTDDRLLDLLADVVTLERDFFDDHADPWFLVAIIPNGDRAGPRGFTLGGTGLTDCFALFCAVGLELTPGSEHTERILHLLAHEYFHNWNGTRIRIDAPEGEAYWFTEGVTEFFTRRLLRRAGLWTESQWLDDLNRSIAGFDTSPVREATNSRVAEGFWSDRSLAEIPYRRGDLLALYLNEKVIAHTGDPEGLDRVMRSLHRLAETGLPPLNPEQLFGLLASHAGVEAAAVARDCVESGAQIPLPRTIRNGAYRLTTGNLREPDDGFDIEASRAAGRITGVRPATGAFEAGLRDGQALVSVYDMPPGDGPPRLSVVTRDGSGAVRTVVFEAVGEPRVVRRYVPAEERRTPLTR